MKFVLSESREALEQLDRQLLDESPQETIVRFGSGRFADESRWKTVALMPVEERPKGAMFALRVDESSQAFSSLRSKLSARVRTGRATAREAVMHAAIADLKDSLPDGWE